MNGPSLNKSKIAGWYAARQVGLRLEAAHYEYLPNILGDDWCAQSAWQLCQDAYSEVLRLGCGDPLVLTLTVLLRDSRILVTDPPALEDLQTDLHPVTPPSLVVRFPTPIQLWNGLEEYRRPIEHAAFSAADPSVSGVYLVRRSEYDRDDPEPYTRYLLFQRFPPIAGDPAPVT